MGSFFTSASFPHILGHMKLSFMKKQGDQIRPVRAAATLYEGWMMGVPSNAQTFRDEDVAEAHTPIYTHLRAFFFHCTSPLASRDLKLGSPNPFTARRRDRTSHPAKWIPQHNRLGQKWPPTRLIWPKEGWKVFLPALASFPPCLRPYSLIFARY